MAAPARDEPIGDLLAALAAGREGDALPARLEAVLRRDDEAVGPAVAFIRAGTATKLVADALAAAGTPAAQDALCGLARDRQLPRQVRVEAVASLGLVRRPIPRLMAEVGELIRGGDPDLFAPTLFLAGTVARAGRAEHPGPAAAIEKIVLAAAALGNLGSASVLPRLRTAVTAGDPRVRAAATRALRLVPDAEADQLLAATLRRDRDPTVRAAALFAAGFRDLDPLADALADAARNDPVEYVRAGAVTLLAREPQTAPAGPTARTRSRTIF
jgi:HEAT repeat protein